MGGAARRGVALAQPPSRKVHIISATSTRSLTVPASERIRGRRDRGKLARQQSATAYLLVAPFFTIFALMIVLPLLYALGVSMFSKRIIGGTTFVGLENFVRAVTDPQLLEGLGRVGVYMLAQIPLTLGLAVVFALAFDSGRVRGSKTARLLMFLPNAIPAVVATLMWGYLYGNEFGPIAQLTAALGLPSPDLLAPSNIMYGIVNIAFWGALGYNMIILYAALQSIPSELYEAAELDGASALRTAWSIKIPAILPAITLCILLSFIGGFQLFNEPNLLAPLAPGAINSSYTPNIYIYNTAFASQDVGYAAAMSFVLGLLIVIISYVVQLSTTRKERG
ncbi:sugar ABC transporter permease [Microbacterium sp. NPDC079995]|uniref:carbohydrate ABC transporter permease n=1 Tax=unclassified Microbacterium TaxID=2609290 RepID=UPI00344BD02C